MRARHSASVPAPSGGSSRALARTSSLNDGWRLERGDPAGAEALSHWPAAAKRGGASGARRVCQRLVAATRGYVTRPPSTLAKGVRRCADARVALVMCCTSAPRAVSTSAINVR